MSSEERKREEALNNRRNGSVSFFLQFTTVENFFASRGELTSSACIKT